MTESLLSLESVSRIYGTDVEVHALNQVSLEIFASDFLSIVGPSGSGKSTMLGLLGLLDVPSKGNVKVKGTDATSMNDFQRSRLRGDAIGFVFQQFHLIPHLSALGNVETALLYRGLSSKECNKRATDSLEKVGLGGREDHRPVQLSGGEQQRVAIARAIVTDPLVVLADEPTGALDSRTTEDVLQLFDDLHQQGISVVLVTHENDVAARAKRVARFKDGKILKITPQITNS